MSTPDEKVAFDQQLLDVYVNGLQADLETKLRDLGEVQQTLERLRARDNPAAQILAVRGLARRFSQMLVANRVVRETLLELRETAIRLAEELERGTSA